MTRIFRLAIFHSTASDARVRCAIWEVHGTYVNGGRIQELILEHGQSFRAGDTSFVLRVEHASGHPATAMVGTSAVAPGSSYLSAPRSEPIPKAWKGFKPEQIALLSLLYNGGEPVYAVLDAARDNRVPPLLQAFELEHASLYEGKQGRNSKTWRRTSRTSREPQSSSKFC